jgi:hypothetical protein
VSIEAPTAGAAVADAPVDAPVEEITGAKDVVEEAPEREADKDKAGEDEAEGESKVGQLRKRRGRRYPRGQLRDDTSALVRVRAFLGVAVTAVGLGVALGVAIGLIIIIAALAIQSAIQSSG